MKTATIELTQDEIAKAVQEYVERDGWKVAGKVNLDVTPAQDDGPNRYSPASVKARVQVTR